MASHKNTTYNVNFKEKKLIDKKQITFQKEQKPTPTFRDTPYGRMVKKRLAEDRKES